MAYYNIVCIKIKGINQEEGIHENKETDSIQDGVDGTPMMRLNWRSQGDKIPPILQD